MFSTAFENQVGLRFSKGRLVRVVGPGVHFLFGRGSKLLTIGTRPKIAYVGGQEVMTKDGGTIRISLVMSYRISDAKRYFESGSMETEWETFTPYSRSTTRETQVEIAAKVGLHEWSMERTLRESIDQRAELPAWLTPRLVDAGAEVGIEFERCDLFEFTVTGNLPGRLCRPSKG